MQSSGDGRLTELRQRLLFVLGALLVYRIGTFIPVPGINPEALAALFDQNQGTILDMFNMFSGGALGAHASILALGHHAVHLRLDHHAADVGGDPEAGAAEEGR
jgi:preprotein translocase subunit SecY